MTNYNPQMGYPNTGQAPIATQYPYGINNLYITNKIFNKLNEKGRI